MSRIRGNSRLRPTCVARSTGIGDRLRRSLLDRFAAVSPKSWMILRETCREAASSKPQRDVAGRHDPTNPDLDARYFATYRLKPPRGWKPSCTVGHDLRAALVVFFNNGIDTGTVFKPDVDADYQNSRHPIQNEGTEGRALNAIQTSGTMRHALSIYPECRDAVCTRYGSAGFFIVRRD